MGGRRLGYALAQRLSLLGNPPPRDVSARLVREGASLPSSALRSPGEAPNDDHDAMVWRDRGDIVLSRESRGVFLLPDRCVRCNSTNGTKRLRRRLRFAGLVGLTPMVYITAHDSIDVELSLCRAHALSRTIGTSMLAAAAVAPVVAIFAFTDAAAIGYALAAMLVLVPLAFLLRRTLRIIDCDPIHARVRGGRAFVESFPAE